ncbi:MAG: 3'(2'),5'-bisphosphate nucleotidase CysQ [Gammaproteobacteria bacterium]
MIKPDMKQLIQIAELAGQIVLSIYDQMTINVQLKADHSVLTEADLASHEFICSELKKQYPNIPIISEESIEQNDYAVRKNWDYFFLVDPLDGTKEFIHRNGEFTINIALIKKDQPIMGVINAPALGVIYYAEEGKGAYKKINDQHIFLPRQIAKIKNKLNIAVSRSHSCEKTQQFLAGFIDQEIITIASGSALKFGLIAEGSADIYPRFSPTMEWDTAAGHIIVNEVGKTLTLLDRVSPLQYNKQELKNPGFIVQ